MDSRFKLYNQGCELIIKGLEIEAEEYYPENGNTPSKRQYKYSESVTVNVIQKVHLNSSGDYEYSISNVSVIPHEDEVDLSNITLKEDGLFLVSHIILPTKQYLENCVDSELVEDIYTYYWNPLDGEFYKFNSKEFTLDLFEDLSEYSSVEEIIEINSNSDTTIIRSDQNAFNTCYLSECLFWKLKERLTNQAWNNCGKSIKNYEDCDIIWMSLHVIKYLLEFNQYNEVFRIYNNLISCGNLCSNKYTADGTTGCKKCGT